MQLTDDQETLAATIEDQWLAHALETGPADHAAAEAAVHRAYDLAGLPAPERIYWLGSPRAGAIAAALLAGAAAPGQGAPDEAREVAADLSLQGWQPGDRAGRSVRGQIRTAPWAAARAAASAEFGRDGWAQLSAAAGRRAWPLTMDRIAARLRTRLGEDLLTLLPGGLGRQAKARLLDAVYGQHDAPWLAVFVAAARFGADHPQLEGLGAIARQTGWWWAYERVAIVTERPDLIARDNVGRLHRGEGPALSYADGYGLWAWRGMPIPPELVDELPRLTVDRIRAEGNAELRRVMLEHYGYERYLRDAGAAKIHTDDTGTLWRLDLTDDEPLVMVEVVNSTPEPDGTSRIYWLRVPPTVRTAREGVAWTFGLTEEEYQPLAQT